MSNRLDWILQYNKDNDNEYQHYVFTGKYLAVQKPNHPKARNDGYVYIHQLQAEKKLGRMLKDEECVHHVNENKYDNSIDNLMIFKTNSDHIAFHHGCDIYLDNDVWIAKPNKNRICPICNTNIKDYDAMMCLSCFLKHKSSHMPSKDVLLDLILKYSMTKIGKMYGVSDNAVRKWCKKYNLPFLKNDIQKLKLETII